MHTKKMVNIILWGTLTAMHCALMSFAVTASAEGSPYRIKPDNARTLQHAKTLVNVSKIEKPYLITNPDLISNKVPQSSTALQQLSYQYQTDQNVQTFKTNTPLYPAQDIKRNLPGDLQSELSPPANACLTSTNTTAAMVTANQPFFSEIAFAANAASLDPSLVHAVIYVESRYRHNALSNKGAVGLMQVLPDTAARYGLRNAVYSPQGNIKAGTLYLRDLMKMFDYRLDLVLAAYNAGEGAVKKYAGQIPPYPETRHYVKAVMAKYALNTGTNQWCTPRPATNTVQANKIQPSQAAPATYISGTQLNISKQLFTLNQPK